MFFLSGKTYYEVLWTAPAGNVYYNLAHQYIAAKLNVLDGTTAPANVQAAITSAETFFNTYGPDCYAVSTGAERGHQQCHDTRPIQQRPDRARSLRPQ